MIERAYKIPVPKNNGGLLRHLIVVVAKKKGIVSKLET